MSARSIVMGLLVQLTVRFSGLVSGVLGAAFLARGMTPDEYGTFTVTLSIIALSAMFTELGLNSAAVRAIASKEMAEERILGALFIARILTSIAAFLLGLTIAALTFGPAEVTFTTALIASTVLLAPLTSAQPWAQANLKFKVQNTILLVQGWLWPIATVIAFLVGGGGTTFAWAYTAAALASALITRAALRIEIRPSYDALRPTLVALLRVSLPLAVTGIFVTAYYRIGALVLAHASGSAEAATFTAAFRLMDPLQVLPGTLMVALLPLLSRTYAGQPDASNIAKREAIMDLALRASLLAGLPLAVWVSLTAPTLVDLIYGPTYASSAPVLQTLIWAFPAICLGYFVVNVAIASKMIRPYSMIIAAVALTNIAASVAVIPRHGALGAAWVTVVTEVVVGSALLAMLTLKKVTTVHWHSLARIAAAGAAMGLALYPVRAAHPAISVTVAVVALAAASFLTRAVTAQDLRLLLNGRSTTS